MSNRLSQKKRLAPDERAAQLLSVALELFAEKGVGRVGHADIAKRAGISTATVFHYFPTIDGLNSRVMDVVHNAALAIFKSPPAPAQTSPTLILGERLLEIAENQPDLVKIFLNWSHAYGEPFRMKFLNLKAEILDLIAESLSPRENANIDAQIIFGTGLMLAQMKLEGADDTALERFSQRVAQLIG